MNPAKRELRGKKVAVLMADGFEMVEYTVPVQALRLAGADISVISLRHGRIRGVNLHEPAHKVHVDLTLDEADAGNYDALFIPGGFINPDLLRQSAKVRRFVRDFEETGKPIATLCHGPWVLASSKVIQSRTLTSWPGIRDDVINAGGVWVDEPVVRDRNWITSRGPQDLVAFVPALIEHFADAVADANREADAIARAPSPPRNEPPDVMIQAMKWMPRPSFRGFAIGLVAGYALLKRSSAVRSS